MFIVSKGEPQAYGTYQELVDSGIDFTQLLPGSDGEDDQDKPERTVSKIKDIDEDIALLQKQVMYVTSSACDQGIGM
jgi:hypothetical protein